jgi:UDP-N-acetylmuramate dehydrogenase
MKEAYKKWLKDHFGPLVVFDEPMSRHTTFRIGGPANIVTVKTDGQLKDLVRWADENGQAFMILGAGSNLLVRDEGVSGLVLKLANGFESIEQGAEGRGDERVWVTAGAGALVRQLGKYAIDYGLAGLSFTLGIPGTIGGALRMNAGAWGSCMADTTAAISVLRKNGDIDTVDKNELRFSYRRLDLEAGSIILRGEFELKRADREALRRKAAQMQKKRMLRQPLSLPSAGSIFRNPTGEMSAGELIDQAGLKGLRAGEAEISTKHANFIVNKGHAKASDVLALMGQVQETVSKRFGVELEPEVIIVG